MASQLRGEILGNFESFSAQWPQELQAAQVALKGASKYFEQSYIRISSIQAWRAAIAINMPEEAEAFFFEAQNDFLISHCLSNCGSFRSALKALRAAIENVYFFLYYKDHPVELEKWNFGRHKLGFTELTSYFEAHPSVLGKQLAANAISALKDEYSTLSKAVHGSAKAFRMTQNLCDIRLWGGDAISVGKWSAREKIVIGSLNILLIHIFRDSLVGAKARGLRETLGLVIPKAQHSSIKSETGIVLIAD
jgi:hypothetical protein